jgi:hypothetical protein
MAVAGTNLWLISRLLSGACEWVQTLHYSLGNLLSDTVSLLKYTDLLLGLYLHQNLDLDTIPAHLLCHTNPGSYLCCNGHMRCDRHCSVFYVYLRLLAGVCFLGRLEKA